MDCWTLLLTSLCNVKYRFEVLYHNRREAEARYFWVSRWSKPSFPLLWFVRPFPWFLSRCRLRYGRRFRPVWSDRSHVWYDLCASVWNAVRLPIMPFSSELRRLCVFWGERDWSLARLIWLTAEFNGCDDPVSTDGFWIIKLCYNFIKKKITIICLYTFLHLHNLLNLELWCITDLSERYNLFLFIIYESLITISHDDINIL